MKQTAQTKGKQWIAYEKLSKKQRREIDAKQRGTWGALNPVTRKAPNPKAYNRKKAGRLREDSPRDLPFLFFLPFFAALPEK